jgi:UDP-glucuronate 4-epimerase
MDFLSLLETSLGKKALLEMVDAQPGDVLETWSDCSDLQQDFGYHAHVSMEEGMARFAAWFRDYYSV